MQLPKQALLFVLPTLVVHDIEALKTPKFPGFFPTSAYPATYLPTGGPPDEQVDLWPRGMMPVKPSSRLQPEQFLRTNETPFENQALRYRCSPNHVGTHGHFAMYVSNPTIAPFVVPGSDVAVVIAPSGGGLHLNWDVESVAPAKLYNQWGISAFIIKHRVPTRNWGKDVYMKDTQRAISMVRTKYNMRLVGIHGACFGGLVVMEASTMMNRSYEKVDEVDDSSFLPDFSVMLYPQGTNIFRQPATVPPVFSAVSRDDNCVGVTPARLYDQRAKRAKALHEIHVYPHGMHGWGTCEYYPFLQGEPECGWPSNLKRFLIRAGMITA